MIKFDYSGQTARFGLYNVANFLLLSIDMSSIMNHITLKLRGLNERRTFAGRH